MLSFSEQIQNHAEKLLKLNDIRTVDLIELLNAIEIDDVSELLVCAWVNPWYKIWFICFIDRQTHGVV